MSTMVERFYRQQKMIKLVNEGIPTREVARRFDITPSAVRYNLRYSFDGKSLREVYVPLLAAKSYLFHRLGVSAGRIARALQISPTRVVQLLHDDRKTAVKPPTALMIIRPVRDNIPAGKYTAVELDDGRIRLTPEGKQEKYSVIVGLDEIAGAVKPISLPKYTNV